MEQGDEPSLTEEVQQPLAAPPHRTSAKLHAVNNTVYPCPVHVPFRPHVQEQVRGPPKVKPRAALVHLKRRTQSDQFTKEWGEEKALASGNGRALNRVLSLDQRDQDICEGMLPPVWSGLYSGLSVNPDDGGTVGHEVIPAVVRERAHGRA